MAAPVSWTIDDIPLPQDVVPGPGWTGQMREMAAHIGPYATLLVVDRFGGQDVYIAADPARNVLRDLIGADKAAIMSRVYRRERLQIPTAKLALRRARRQPVIAMARAGDISIAKAAQILKSQRSYVSWLVNHGDEGDVDPASWAKMADDIRRAQRDPRQIELFEQ